MILARPVCHLDKLGRFPGLDPLMFWGCFFPLTIVSWMLIPTLSQAHLSCECSAYLVTMYSNFSGKGKLKWGKKQNYNLPKQVSWMCWKDGQNRQSTIRSWMWSTCQPKAEAGLQTQWTSWAEGVAYPGLVTDTPTTHQRMALQEALLHRWAPSSCSWLLKNHLAPGTDMSRLYRENPFIHRHWPVTSRL